MTAQQIPQEAAPEIRYVDEMEDAAACFALMRGLRAHLRFTGAGLPSNPSLSLSSKPERLRRTTLTHRLTQ
jgi:hypothetical protein